MRHGQSVANSSLRSHARRSRLLIIVMDILLFGVPVFLVAYLIGSLPTAYTLTRFHRGIDIRTVGSRNPGAVNVFREVGPWAGLTVLAVDAMKGAVVMLSILALDLRDYAMFVGALAVVIGHNWPVFLHFRGGKGVATCWQPAKVAHFETREIMGWMEVWRAP